MSSEWIERMAVEPALTEGAIVACPTPECPRPSACPYSCVSTPWMSKRLPRIVPGPSSQVHSSQKRMRQPSEIGVSVKARVPLPPQSASEETVLWFVVPMPDELPAHIASKLAPPSPSTLPPCGSPEPLPWSLLPHSTMPFQTASSAPVQPGNWDGET